MLINKDNTEKLFIEIAVSHFISNEKENSNYRIIEINIENEDDLKIVYDRCLSINHKNVKFQNFKNKIKTKHYYSGNCDTIFHFLSLDSNGRVLLKSYNLPQIRKILFQSESKIIKYSIEATTNISYSFKHFVAICAKENFLVRNCFICRYHAVIDHCFDDRYEKGKPIFCKFLKISCNSNKAVGCEYFKKEKKYIDEILNPTSNFPDLPNGLNDKLDNQIIVTHYYNPEETPEEKILRLAREQAYQEEWERQMG